jgi:16S rRNA (uracil1498-N3)-methyltransferase
MECLYTPDFSYGQKYISPDESELKHLRALRLRADDEVMITNGKGLAAVCHVDQGGDELTAVEYLHEYGEEANPPAIAMGLLSSRDRFEYALEKAVEFGACEFYPLITRYSQGKKIKRDRLRAKAVAAMKQCKRSRLIDIHQPVGFEEFINNLGRYDTIIVADPAGRDFGDIEISGKLIFLIGPEGGFSEEEITATSKLPGVRMLRLGCRRLRAESAAAGILALFSLQNE